MAVAKKIVCPMCGAENTEKDLYIGKSEIYSFYGKIPFCKPCIEKIFKKYLNEYKDDKKAIYLMCQRLDIPFKYSAYEGASKEAKSKKMDVYKTYFIKLNSLGGTNNYGSCFDDSDKWEDGDIVAYELDLDDFEVTPKMIRFWGRGYSKEDYVYLEDAYKEWTTRYKCDTLAEEKTYKLLSLKELEIMKAREKGKDVDKLEETFRKLMSDANVTPREANAINDPENMNSLGIWIKDIEKYRPAEYFEDKKIYSDFDSLKEYLDRFVFRPLKNLLLGTREFDKDFNVENVTKEEEIEVDGDDNGES